MPSCAFIQCTNHSRRKNKTLGVTFHSFPQDELWRHKWLVVVRNQRCEHDWTPTTHSRVCSIHFNPSDVYKTKKGLAKIIKGAVPHFQAAMESANYCSSRSSSPNSLQNENISDLIPEISIFESTFDTPRKSYLKLKMRKILNNKKEIMKENKNLKRRNKRLIEKCKSLKECIAKLYRIVRRRNEKHKVTRGESYRGESEIKKENVSPVI